MRRALSLALLLLLTAVPLATATVDGTARASVSIAVTWDNLLHESTAAAVVTPVESHCGWEGRRIYTYTRARVDRAVAGELGTSTEAWVRTMGGVVGKIGQIVEGEAVLAPGQPSLLFLRAGPNGAFEVTARGQGQFPVVAGDGSKAPLVVRSHSAGALVAPQLVTASASGRLATDVMHGRPVDDVAREVAADWSRVHARP